MLPALKFDPCERVVPSAAEAYWCSAPTRAKQKATLALPDDAMTNDDSQAILGRVNGGFWVFGDWVAAPETVVVGAVEQLIQLGWVVRLVVDRTIHECEDGIRRIPGWQRSFDENTGRFQVPQRADGTKLYRTVDGIRFPSIAEDACPAFASLARTLPDFFTARHSDWLAWERQLYDNPDDAELRLVYADWLTDHDWPGRAALVRRECWYIARRKRCGLSERAWAMKQALDARGRGDDDGYERVKGVRLARRLWQSRARVVERERKFRSAVKKIKKWLIRYRSIFGKVATRQYCERVVRGPARPWQASRQLTHQERAEVVACREMLPDLEPTPRGTAENATVKIGGETFKVEKMTFEPLATLTEADDFTSTLPRGHDVTVTMEGFWEPEHDDATDATDTEN